MKTTFKSLHVYIKHIRNYAGSLGKSVITHLPKRVNAVADRY